MDRYEKIQLALKTQGMRPANTWERGWYVMVLIDGESSRVWATDEGAGS